MKKIKTNKMLMKKQEDKIYFDYLWKLTVIQNGILSLLLNVFENLFISKISFEFPLRLQNRLFLW